MSDRENRRGWGVGGIMCGVMLGLYTIGYYGMVHPFPVGAGVVLPRYVSPVFLGPLDFETTTWDRIYLPLHNLDRRLRPHVWEPR